MWYINHVLSVYNYSSWTGENVKIYMQNMDWNVQKGIFKFYYMRMSLLLVIRKFNLAFRVRNHLYLLDESPI